MHRTDSNVPSPHSTQLPRRRALETLAALGTTGWLASLTACGGGDGGTPAYLNVTGTTSGSTAGTTTGTATACSAISEVASETGGPYPADGSNSNTAGVIDVLAMSGIVRRDIRSNLDGSSVRTGVPVTLTMTVLNLSCQPLIGAAVYVWHCDKDGTYSAYTVSTNDSGTNHNADTFLRGVQLTDANGQVTFTTIYPGWYAGRITHMHFEVYANGQYATGTPTKTSQLAFPTAISTAVYGSTLYAAHGQNTSVTSFAADNIFSDGTSTEMLTLTGDTSGYAATITVGVNV